VFQSFFLLPTLSARENVQVPMFEGPMLSVRNRAKKADMLLELVGLARRARHRPTQLSVGERQRVALARALANDPVLLLADEPTGNLDSATSNEIMEMLTSLNKEGRTIIMVTHEPDIANWARRQIVMRDGVVFKEALTADILRAAAAPAGEPVAAH
jgi:putative ABC transport system ATP-binding protein